MTISIDRANSVNATHLTGGTTVQPADVWDLNRGARSLTGKGNVRTLDSSIRTQGHRPEMRSRYSNAVADGEQPDMRREKRTASVMGVLLGMSLLIGSALGGAFSGDGSYSSYSASSPGSAGDSGAVINVSAFSTGE